MLGSFCHISTSSFGCVGEDGKRAKAVCSAGMDWDDTISPKWSVGASHVLQVFVGNKLSAVYGSRVHYVRRFWSWKKVKNMPWISQFHCSVHLQSSWNFMRGCFVRNAQEKNWYLRHTAKILKCSWKTYFLCCNGDLERMCVRSRTEPSKMHSWRSYHTIIRKYRRFSVAERKGTLCPSGKGIMLYMTMLWPWDVFQMY